MSPFEKVILRKRPIAIQLSLYYGIGRYVSINLQQAHWGAKALDEEWQCLSIGSPMANQLQQNAY